MLDSPQARYLGRARVSAGAGAVTAEHALRPIRGFSVFAPLRQGGG